MSTAKTMQPDGYKAKTTIIPANPGIATIDGLIVVAWVIEDGQIARAICHDPKRYVDTTVQRSADE